MPKSTCRPFRSRGGFRSIAAVLLLCALFTKLKADPVVVKELAALADEDKLVTKYFGSWFDYKKGADPKASEATITLADKHAGTLREPVLRKLAEPCVKP